MTKYEQLLPYFRWRHLPQHLQPVSRKFGELALHVVRTTPPSEERVEALRKLLEAKDCAVRAHLQPGEFSESELEADEVTPAAAAEEEE